LIFDPFFVVAVTILNFKVDDFMRPERDDREAIDKSNIVEGRTRGATKKAGTYAEPGDEEVSFGVRHY
jgi:hypothetical protein